MSAQNDFPVIDGIVPSFVDIIARATPGGGSILEVGDIAKVSRKRAVTIGEQSSGGRVKKRTTGTVKYEMTVAFYYDAWLRYVEALAAVAPSRGNQKRIGLVHVGWQIQYTPIGSVQKFEWRAKGARLIGDSMDAAEGDDPNQVEVPFNVIEIVDMVNGVEVLMV